ncbi:BQ5605_C049g12430 [Microbotryum silenes-dioicae]|uniref:alpha-1,2-Mannosidase n=1 Tax=Microbotryum silenes-dioicae TaxID=796604 RepID=A0A2X0PNH2_9BASI|nr:BQ5605_C049g12430 [Microbotryum silenes-dioicae]
MLASYLPELLPRDRVGSSSSSSSSGHLGSHLEAREAKHAAFDARDENAHYTYDMKRALIDEEIAFPEDVRHLKPIITPRPRWGRWGPHRCWTIGGPAVLLGAFLLALFIINGCLGDPENRWAHASPSSKEAPPHLAADIQGEYPDKGAKHLRPIPPSIQNPWSHMPTSWKGGAWLAKSRFVTEKGAASLPKQVGPPARHLASAFKYFRAATEQLVNYGRETRFDPETGRLLQVPLSELKLLHEGLHEPILNVGNLEKGDMPGGEHKRPKVQYTGRIDMSDERVQEEANRREWVKRAFLHAWDGYKTQWGHDEVKPVSGGSTDHFNGWGAVIIDSLDTLLIMGLNEEYNLAREHVSAVDFSYTISGGTDSNAKSPPKAPELEELVLPTQREPPLPMSKLYDFPLRHSMSYFETTIRYLGGLISAYDLSGDPLMLNRATELGTWMVAGLNTHYAVPNNEFLLGENPSNSFHSTAWLAEVGSLSLEFTRLSMISGDETYYQAVQRTTNKLDEVSTKGPSHLLPIAVNVASSGPAGGTVSFGACSDSYYEYLIKMAHLLGDYDNGQYARMYKDAIDAAYGSIIRPVGVVPDHRNLINIGDNNSHGSNYVPKLEHLTCFAGGMLGLGAKLLARQKDLETGEAFTETCQWAYESSPTGLMPETLLFFPPDDPPVPQTKEGPGQPPAGIKQSDPSYIGRPETIESVFYMWRITGDRVWQDRGWRMFVDWVSHSIAEFGFAGLTNVNDANDLGRRDSQESFVLAETLKYYYLLFADREHISLDDYVFNTEAHPFALPPRDRARPKKLWKGTKVSPEESARGQGTVVQLWDRIIQVVKFNAMLE